MSKRRSARQVDILPTKKIVILAIVSISVLLFMGLPAFRAIRTGAVFQMIFKILWKLSLSSVAIFFTWIYKDRPSSFARWLSTLNILLLWIPYLVSHKLVIIVIILITTITCVYFVTIYLSKQKFDILLASEFGYFAMALLLSISDYSFIDKSTENRIILGAIPFGVAALVATAVLIIKGKIVLFDDRLSERVALPFVVALFVSAFCCGVFANLNYALDTSEAKRKTSVITEKDIEYHTKSGDDYILSVGVDGKIIEVNVSEGEWYEYEVGDSYVLIYYEGAFGVAFYISEAIE